ncbi:MAG: SpaH/EbpB family LPXTG-anchored major pilin [Acidobacteriota bacterium]|nr:SpaH/EbpB family LPXTG-anchored major pilin [Acidobacteriota bacterium]
MNSKDTLARRILAVVGALGLGASTMIGASTAAFAAVGDVGPDQPNHPNSGSLSIHKRVGAQGSAGDGTELQTPPGTPLAGAQFTIWQLGKDASGSCQALDLTQPDAWASVPTGTAPTSIADVQAAGFCLVAPTGTAQTTDAAGMTTFSDLGLGLYYVQETSAPASVVSKAAPFYVSIPLPHADGSWIYNVHAYPKNQVTEGPAKTINTTPDQPAQGLVVGSTVEWTITQTVPALNAGEVYTSASIWDVLPADGSLEYASTTSVMVGNTVLVEGTDYTINTAGVTWTLTETGRGKIQAGDVITVVFKTKVLKVTQTGEIANPGSDGSEPGYGSEFNGSKVPGVPTPYTYWGALNVTKVDKNQAALAGAVFEIYQRTGTTCAAEAPTTGLVSTGTSGTDGVVTWTPNTPDNSSPLGLFVANSNDGPLVEPTMVYCLYETRAPSGYTGVGVQTVTIHAGSTLIVDVNDLTIENKPKEGPNLPLTGAEGTLAMSVGGIMLVAAGMSIYLVSRRRQTQQA